MRVRIRSAAIAGVTAILVALPGAAEARTKRVWAGPPPANAGDFRELGSDVNDFFPHRVTIRRGDKVRFLPAGFHNVDLPPRGGDPLPFASPTGEKVAGVNDAAGQPFWFNGQDMIGFTPELGQVAWGESTSYNGKKRRNSGLPLGPEPEPYTVKFKRKGSFRYFCDVHAGMTGVVRVKARRAKVPSKKADRRALRRQVKSSLKVARELPDTETPTGGINVGVAGPDGEEFLDFVPKTATVPTGTTLRFRMSPGSHEVHTATAGPGDPGADPSSYLGQLAASFQAPVFDPRAAYPSDPPPNPATLTPVLHGNGFWNTGVLDNTSATPLPDSNAVTFGAPGTYDFYCLIHPFMKATVTVQ